MTKSADLQKGNAGRVILDCALTDGTQQRYEFTDTRALITFTRGMAKQVEVNLALLSRRVPVPADLLPRTRLMLAVIKQIIAFIDSRYPQYRWNKKLFEDISSAIQEAERG